MPFSLWLPGSLGPDLKFNYNNFVTLECLSFWLGFSRLTYISPPRSFVPALLCSVLQFVPLCDPGMRWERNELIIEGTDESTSAEKTRLLDRLHCGDEWVFLVLSYPSLQCGCCSVAKLCPILCKPMDCSMPGSPVLHCLSECSNSCPLSL